MKKNITSLMLLLGVMAITSCSSDKNDPPPGPESRTITFVKAKTIFYGDKDGNNLSCYTIELSANSLPSTKTENTDPAVSTTLYMDLYDEYKDAAEMATGIFTPANDPQSPSVFSFLPGNGSKGARLTEISDGKSEQTLFTKGSVTIKASGKDFTISGGFTTYVHCRRSLKNRGVPFGISEY